MKHAIYVSAFATSEYGDAPRFAKVIIDDEFVREVRFLAELIDTHSLSEVRRFASPEAWGPGEVAEELRLQGGELIVTKGGSFWFTDFPKHASYSVETRSQSIDDIIKSIEAGEDPIFGENIDDLREYLEEAGEIQLAEEA